MKEILRMGRMEEERDGWDGAGDKGAASKSHNPSLQGGIKFNGRPGQATSKHCPSEGLWEGWRVNCLRGEKQGGVRREET